MRSALYRRLCTIVCLLIHAYNQRRDAQLEFMAAEIRILRKRVPGKHLKFNPEEQDELLALGAHLKHQVKDCLLIATYKTYQRWLRNRAAGKEAGRVGRKRTCQSVAQLVLRMAKTNVSWGYDRIVGELGKLGIKRSDNTVKHILRRGGVDPVKGASRRWSPTRRWRQFIDSHASSLLGCDFVSVRMLTVGGWVDAFLFVVIHLESRRVYMSPATLNPNHLWLAQQVRQVAMWCDDEGIQARHLIRDNDGKFGKTFDATVRSVGWKPVRTSFFTPDMNAFVEAFLGNTRRECFNHFTFFTLAQVDRVASSWLRHYLSERPHQGKGIGNRVLDKTFVPQTEGRIRCQRTLAGLFSYYYRDTG